MDSNAVKSLKNKIDEIIDEIKSDIFDVADRIYENPEIGGKEFNAVNLLTDKIKKYGFEINYIEDLPTAFVAKKSGFRNGPTIAYILEYDALPELGHACGHNIIASTSFGAGIALSILSDQIKGNIVLIGTPAEENLGYKTLLIKKGVFNDIDVAMMIHPYDITTPYVSSLALQDIEFSFKGKPSHAAVAPHLGVNALDALILLFNNINALRQQLKSDVRIHGIITDGGKAPNIIPDSAKAYFFVRALNKNCLNEVVEKVINCGKAAEIATGTTLSYRSSIKLDDLVTNKILADRFAINLKGLGYNEISYEQGFIGSTDMGSVSYIIPSIHPFINIAKEKIDLHTQKFCEAAGSNYAKEMSLLAAKALAQTGIDVLTDGNLLGDIKKEFYNKNKDKDV
ncbi:M20 family metallopeptidase [Thermoanaerobacterium sp. RBIITD]|uniref:M20 family metallopeptidase n=1 Tax=Thermoanaerobacterium sp. RBIITD TaxID=1550240 RepID=UPI000BB99B60|nr:M20 family metallopeptidase [Thermoanaerobacterium sp. RBIITD]SNX52717.1 amidohydrolase [Thermoanaerobacterium sp. RBIITD]